MLGEQFEVDAAQTAIEKHVLAGVAALGDVMRCAHRNHAFGSRHGKISVPRTGGNSHQNEETSRPSPVFPPVFPPGFPRFSPGFPPVFPSRPSPVFPRFSPPDQRPGSLSWEPWEFRRWESRQTGRGQPKHPAVKREARKRKERKNVV